MRKPEPELVEAGSGAVINPDGFHTRSSFATNRTRSWRLNLIGAYGVSADRLCLPVRPGDPVPGRASTPCFSTTNGCVHLRRYAVAGSRRGCHRPHDSRLGLTPISPSSPRVRRSHPDPCRQAMLDRGRPLERCRLGAPIRRAEWAHVEPQGPLVTPSGSSHWLSFAGVSELAGAGGFGRRCGTAQAFLIRRSRRPPRGSFQIFQKIDIGACNPNCMPPARPGQGSGCRRCRPSSIDDERRELLPRLPASVSAVLIEGQRVGLPNDDRSARTRQRMGGLSGCSGS